MQSRLLKKPLLAARQFGHWLAKENYFFGKLVGASAAGILSIVLLGILFLVATNEKVPRDQLRGTALETLGTASRIESDLNVMENAHRDYVATGDAPLRLQFDAAQSSLESRVGALTSKIGRAHV